MVAQPDTLFSAYSTPVNWGRNLTTADYNGDGWNDLAVLSPMLTSSDGRFTGGLDVFYGSVNGFSPKPDFHFQSQYTGHLQGLSNGTSGDFNNDGFADLAVGNPFYGEPQLDRGFIQIFWGDKIGIEENNVHLVEGKTAYGSYGSYLATLDFNGDQVDDLLVEARFDQILEGRIYIYLGGIGFNPEKPDFCLQAENSQSLYFAFAHDFNFDGCDDVVCRTNPGWNATLTKTYFFYGGKHTDHKYVDVFEKENFSPVEVMSDTKHQRHIIFGAYSNNNKVRFTKGLEYAEGLTGKIVFEIQGVFFKISNHYVLIKNGESHQLQYFQFKNGSFEPVFSQSPFSEHTIISRHIIFQSRHGAPKQLVLQAQINERECLLILPLPEEISTSE